MTKGHNKEPNSKSKPEPENKQGQGQQRHLTDQQKKKGPQGRHPDEDESGGTKGQNAI